LNADPIRLTQVFGNLLGNASKYTTRAGEISLAARTDGEWVRISVKDNGIGIMKERLTDVFELFAQVDEAPERAHSGIGIGLTLARQLVELHGGVIEATSEGLGKGSEFIVRLPILAERTSPLPAEATPDEQVRHHPHRILVVDDNEDSATSLATLLELTGHETHTANDGLAALAVADRVRPNVILLDIGLPHKNGYEVCREIRRESWGKGVLMIAITGWGQEEDRLESRNAGFDQHLTKPIDFGVLNQLLVAPAGGTSPG
jgi:CheY-like chemotaxis protein